MFMGYKKIVLLGLVGFGLDTSAASVGFHGAGIYSYENSNHFSGLLRSGSDRYIDYMGSYNEHEENEDDDNDHERSRRFGNLFGNDDEEEGESHSHAHPNPNFPHEHFPTDNFPLETFPGHHYPEHFEEYPFPWSGNYCPPPSPVPVPAAVWLFGSGLIGMAAFARRKG